MENNSSEAKDFEKSKQALNWNKFLYDFSLLKIKEYKTSNYAENAFGSWYIEFETKRLIYDGKDFWFIVQHKKDND